MVRPVVGDKRSDIRQATVDEVAAVGSTAVSVNKIAERAGVAVGTIYRFHDTKNELLAAVFLQVKMDIHNAMMREASQFTSTYERLRAMWFAIVHYGYAAPNDFHFAEVMSADVRNLMHKDERLTRLRAEVLTEFDIGIANGTLAEVSLKAIETVMASTASSMARIASFSGTPPEMDDLEEVYALVWNGIARST